MNLLLRRSLYPVLIVYFLDVFGLAVVYPVFSPLLLKPEFGFISNYTTLFERTLAFWFLIACFPIAQIFGSPLIGEFSDMYGRKKAFVATILGTGIGYLLTALAIEYQILSLLFISRLWTGFFAGNLTICLATVTDISTDEHSRAKNFGLIGGVGGFSFILAILAGGALYTAKSGTGLHPSLPFFLIALISLVNLILMLILFKESFIPNSFLSRPNPIKGLNNIISALRNKPLRMSYLIYFFFVLCWVTSMQDLPGYLIHVYGMGANAITWTFIANGLIWSLANLVVNPFLADRFQPHKTLLICLILLGVLLIALLPEKFPVFIAVFLLGVFCASLSWTNCIATVSLSAPKDIQGAILGVNQSLSAAASIAGPFIGGIVGSFDSHLTYVFTGLCGLVAALLLYKNQRVIAKNS